MRHGVDNGEGVVLAQMIVGTADCEAFKICGEEPIERLQASEGR
jgi:hypothetical protein